MRLKDVNAGVPIYVGNYEAGERQEGMIRLPYGYSMTDEELKELAEMTNEFDNGRGYGSVWRNADQKIFKKLFDFVDENMVEKKFEEFVGDKNGKEYRGKVVAVTVSWQGVEKMVKSKRGEWRGFLLEGWKPLC